MSVLLSVDIEDWAQSTLDSSLPVTARSERNTHHLLDVLAEHNQKVTCFVLGKYAEKFPESVRRMAEEGHEIASHGHGHVDVYLQTRREFWEDLCRSKGYLEDLTGHPVSGYRAPNFSLGPAADWALQVVADLGFAYDSSIFPASSYKNGCPGWPSYPAEVRLPSGDCIVEIPAATKDFFGRTWPVAGGGYFRLLPWLVIKRLVKASIERDGIFVTYCHPYEFDPTEFREMVDPPGWKVRLHQGLGRQGFERKFVNLIEFFPTATGKQVMERHNLPIWELSSVIER